MAINCENFISVLDNETYRPLGFASYTGTFRCVKVNHRKKRIIIEQPTGKEYWEGLSCHYVSTDTEGEKFDMPNMKLLYEDESEYLIVDEILDAIIDNNIPLDYEVYIKGRHVEDSGHHVCYPYICPVKFLVHFKDAVYWFPYYNIKKDDYIYERDDDYAYITSRCMRGKLLTNNT